MFQVSQPVSPALALAVNHIFSLSVTPPCLLFPRIVITSKFRKKVSENNASKICPLLPCLHSEVITSQLFTITWSLVLFTVVFKIGILDEPV